MPHTQTRTMRILSLVVLLFALTSPAAAESAQEIDARVDQTLEQLYTESTAAKELSSEAQGILVFPEIVKGGLIVGGEYGEGALRVGGNTQGYYSSASGSLGLQAGISARALVIMFMTDEALEKFTSSNGWEAGADAHVAVAQTGATGSVSTLVSENPVIAFNLSEQGLMAGVSVEGTKVSKIER